ncbi:MAG: recombinase A [Candidatus Eiseniibacteriota bacterium]|jgi:recombination protein RecA
MPRSARLVELADALHLRRAAAPAPAAATRWDLEGLAGRLVELTGDGDSAALTLATGLVLAAQRRGEPVAWVTTPERQFFPPDVAAGGIDLAALPVLRIADARTRLRATDHLLRSGAFGLVVVDLGEEASLSLARQSRLLGLAQRHDTVLLLVTHRARGAPSPGSLVSLRAATRVRRCGEDRFACEPEIVKDKRGGVGHRHRELCRGPAGLH